MLQNHALKMNEYREMGVKHILIDEHIDFLDATFNLLENIDKEYDKATQELESKDKQIDELLEHIGKMRKGD